MCHSWLSLCKCSRVWLDVVCHRWPKHRACQCPPPRTTKTWWWRSGPSGRWSRSIFMPSSADPARAPRLRSRPSGPALFPRGLLGAVTLTHRTAFPRPTGLPPTWTPFLRTPACWPMVSVMPPWMEGIMRPCQASTLIRTTPLVSLTRGPRGGFFRPHRWGSPSMRVCTRQGATLSPTCHTACEQHLRRVPSGPLDLHLIWVSVGLLLLLLLMLIAFIKRYSLFSSRLTMLTCDSAWVTSFSQFFLLNI